MPLFFLPLVGLALHGLTLDGAARALGFLVRPDGAALAHPRTRLAAEGQAFFAIGLAMGILVACGGRLPRARRLPPSALVLAPRDTAVSPVAGLTGIAGRLWLWSLRVLRPAAIALAMGRGLP